VTPTAPIPSGNVIFSFSCSNTDAAPISVGVNDLLLSGSVAPVPDIVALVATATNDGIVHLPGNNGTGAFAVASVNVGASGAISVSADTGSGGLPVTLTVCQTVPTNGQCVDPPAAAVATTINNGATPTFAVFVAGSGAIPFAPATSRIFLRFKDTNGVTRGATSVAAQTDNPTSSGSATLLAAATSGTALTQADVGQIISQVVQEAKARNKPAMIAVVDRLGAVLAVYKMTGAPDVLPVVNNPKGPVNAGLNGVALPTAPQVIAKAVTAAYLSSSHGNAFSTRTASQIVQDHFDPGTFGAPSGPLFGVQFSQLPCSDLAVRLTPGDASSLTRGPHRSPLGLAADPGGLPLYKNGELVGGIGVKAEGPYSLDLNIHDNDHSTDEILALAGTIGFDAPAAIRADRISAGGLLLRYSDAAPGDLVSTPASAPAFTALPAGTGGLIAVSGYYSGAALLAGSAYGTNASGIVQDFSGSISSQVAPYLLVDGSGNVRYPATAGSGPGALTQQEVQSILRSAFAMAIQTRAQIRNPAGSTEAVTISVVDANGTVLGVATVPDAPVFGIDVSLQKARSALFMSSASAAQKLTDGGLGKYVDASTLFFQKPVFSGGVAWSARALGNIARDTYPDGIDGSPNGPLSPPATLANPFNDGFQLDLVAGNLVQHVTSVASANPAGDTPAYCTALSAPVGSPSGLPVLANGLQIFPGGFPIYRNGQVIGGIGISGDGVDQDDMTGFLGLYNAGQQMGTGFGHAPLSIRATTVVSSGISPHYLNCPFAPLVNSSSQNLCTGK